MKNIISQRVFPTATAGTLLELSFKPMCLKAVFAIKDCSFTMRGLLHLAVLIV